MGLHGWPSQLVESFERAQSLRLERLNSEVRSQMRFLIKD